MFFSDLSCLEGEQRRFQLCKLARLLDFFNLLPSHLHHKLIGLQALDEDSILHLDFEAWRELVQELV